MDIKFVPGWTYVNIPAAMADDVEDWLEKHHITEYSMMTTEETPDDVPVGLHYPGINTYDPDLITVIKSHMDHDQLDNICREMYG